MTEGIIIGVVSTLIAGLITWLATQLIRKKQKPFSDNEKELLKEFIKELNELFIIINESELQGSFYFSDVGKEGELEKLKWALDKTMMFNTSFPTQTISNLLNSPFFPIDIKREFPFLISVPFNRMVLSYEGVIIRVIRKDDFPQILNLMAKKFNSKFVVGSPMLTVYYHNHHFNTLRDFYKSMRDLKEYIETKAKVNF